ncbi:MAG: hypothetical protein AAF322_15235 [Pseudomonadota bacterium]
MTDPAPETAFAAIRDAHLAEPGVDLGKMLHAEALRIAGKAYAFLGKDGMVAKLPAERVLALEDEGVGARVTMGKRTMREWAAIPPEEAARWPDLAEEARRFVGGLTGGAAGAGA